MGSVRTGVMLAYPIDEKRMSKLPNIVLIQRKLNGERARIEWHNDKPVIFSSCGNEMPFFRSFKEELIKAKLHNIPFDGEFYKHGLSREEIHSICSRRTNPSIREDELSLHIFDIISDTMTQHWRDNYLYSILPKYLKFSKYVETTLIPKERILLYTDKFIKEGYEGIIIRVPSALYTPRKCNFLLKFKPTSKDTYTIVGFQEEVDKDGWKKDRLGSVQVQDADGNIFSVGTGNALDDIGREFWWRPENRNRLKNCVAHVKHSTIKTINNLPTCTSLLKIEIIDKEQWDGNEN